MPAAIEACWAGFWPWPAVRIWPRITSETCGPSTPARLSDSWTATLPSSWAGRVANAPLKAPTGVRAALTITISSFIWSLPSYPAGRSYRLSVGPPFTPARDMPVIPSPATASLPAHLGRGGGPVNRTGLPVCSAAGVGTDGGCGGIPPRRQRGTDKTVAGFKKNRLCCPADSRSGLLMAKSDRPITIKRYGERRPYNPGAGGYATLDELGAMVEDE